MEAKEVSAALTSQCKSRCLTINFAIEKMVKVARAKASVEKKGGIDSALATTIKEEKMWASMPFVWLTCSAKMCWMP